MNYQQAKERAAELDKQFINFCTENNLINIYDKQFAEQQQLETLFQDAGVTNVNRVYPTIQPSMTPIELPSGIFMVPVGILSAPIELLKQCPLTEEDQLADFWEVSSYIDWFDW